MPWQCQVPCLPLAGVCPVCIPRVGLPVSLRRLPLRGEPLSATAAAVHAMRRRAPRATAGAQSWHKNEPTRSSNPVGLDQGLRNLQNGVVAEYTGARAVHGRLTVFAVEQSVRFLGWLRTDRPRANAAACLPATVTVTNSGVIVTGVAAWFGRMRVPGPKKLSGPVDDGSRRG